MNMKCVITASIFALVSASAAQAADMPVQERPTTVLPQVVVAPAFSWTGFYLGGQIGGFSSNSSSKGTYNNVPNGTKEILVDNKAFPKFSGFVGGLYAGSNVDFGNGFVLGVDTDIVWSGDKASKSKSYEVAAKPDTPIGDFNPADGVSGGGYLGVATRAKDEGSQIAKPAKGDVTFSDKWSGATRVRLGAAFDRVMPYVAGGVAYSQLKASVENAKASGAQKAEGTSVEKPLEGLSDSKTMVGYTLGAGVDFAMTDTVMLRAEYRYSDFGKKKFVKDKVEVDLKTNDFRVGVAYKF
ncbi:outer membrane protein [Bartonella schoenbuchensis]|uniref:Hemin binding protein C n=1 Tax=Bartonella schoenbuchensis (strain DSM 13525 / NCTC 13165 / R1) TaxID=687861 RepID=E6YXW4_BARSR|nr:outer membrane protein [Bartonella schoenbuchensis]AQX30138.1 outer membrane immunogenic protein [Bartonella schoenbuchensis R1]CBI81702.1 Hemin binding protein C [Bartonella schoenbuchensis R1]